MIGGVYVISECIHPKTGEGVWKRTDAVDAVTAICLVARLNSRCIYSRIVAVCERYAKLPVAEDWEKYAADWFRNPAEKMFDRQYLCQYGACS